MKNLIRNICAGILLSTSIAANALVIEQTNSFSNNNLGLSNTTTTGSYGSDSANTFDSLVFDRFDTSLGQLTDVEISFTSDFSHYSYASAYDNSAERYAYERHCSWGSCHYHYRYRNDTFVRSNTQNILSVTLTDPSSTGESSTDYNYDACSRSAITSGSVGCSDSEITNGAFNGSLDLGAFSLSQFEANGIDDLLNLSFQNHANISLSCDNNDSGDTCSGYNNSWWNGSVSVTYTYDPNTIPVPATLSLFLVGLGLMIRRKRKI